MSFGRLDALRNSTVCLLVILLDVGSWVAVRVETVAKIEVYFT